MNMNVNVNVEVEMDAGLDMDMDLDVDIDFNMIIASFREITKARISAELVVEHKKEKLTAIRKR
jgi:hypothetical protein